jgi:hypothetical protein
MARTEGSLSKKTIEALRHKLKEGITLTKVEEEKIKNCPAFDSEILGETKVVEKIEKPIKKRKGRKKKVETIFEELGYPIFDIPYKLWDQVKLLGKTNKFGIATDSNFILQYVFENFLIDPKNGEYVYFYKEVIDKEPYIKHPRFDVIACLFEGRFYKTKLFRGNVSKKELLKWKEKFENEIQSVKE